MATPIVAQRADLAVRAARILDVESGRYRGPSVLLVTGTRITGVLPASRFDARWASRVIDLGDMADVPGFIDAHVHLTIGGPVQVIQAATINAAKALVIGDSVGRFDVGMSADFVAIRGDPLRDITALRSVGLVVSRGRVAVGPPK